MATQQHKLVTPTAPIACHAWNASRSQIAISPSDNTVNVFENKAGAFVKTHTLNEHSSRVCSVDWAPKSNQIVTCGQDRNAYVWKFEDGQWKPTLVILRINRAATCVKWSPDEKKFAVGSGARNISVCYFEEENDWWVAVHIKKTIRSTITSVDWHPNSFLLAAGSTDFKARVFSGYVKELKEPKPGPNSWGSRFPFGEPLAEFGTGIGGGGWVHDVSFSPSGEQLAFVAHDSSITVVDSTKGNQIFRLELAELPFRSLTWITPNSIIAAGFDYVPIAFSYNGAELKSVGKIDVPEKKAAKAESALAKFSTLDKQGRGLTEANAEEIESTHQNVIGQLSIHTGSKANATVLSSTGMDGLLVLWNLKAAATSAGITLA